MLTLTDGGIETALLSAGLELPCFAAFPLLADATGRAALRRYFEPFAGMAAEQDLPFVLDTVTWRASPDWGSRLGYDAAALAEANRDAVAFARELATPEMTINGVVGPAEEPMTAADYHHWQVGVLAEAGVDRITALTLTNAREAIGVIEAAAAAGVPAVVSFTVAPTGRLPDGTAIAAAIEQVDAATDGAAEFFMLNCAHPTHIAAGLDGSRALARIGGLRVNADDSDPVTLGRDHAGLREALPSVTLLGGCCGTDHRHVAEILSSWITPSA
jgi:homocysteine S-methyltransferase